MPSFYARLVCSVLVHSGSGAYRWSTGTNCIARGRLVPLEPEADTLHLHELAQLLGVYYSRRSAGCKTQHHLGSTCLGLVCACSRPTVVPEEPQDTGEDGKGGEKRVKREPSGNSWSQALLTGPAGPTA